MKFQDIKAALVEADNEVLRKWDDRFLGWTAPIPNSDDYIWLLETRQTLLLGAVSAILTELIAREEQELSDG